MGSLALRRGFALGKGTYRLRGTYGNPMRVAFDLLSCVGFICTGDAKSLNVHGTAFILEHDGMLYLVTAKHVSVGLNDCPHLVRFNDQDGRSGAFHIDPQNDDPNFVWFSHPEVSVDIAVMPFPWDLANQGVVAVALRSSALVKRVTDAASEAGCGDMCHVIGLFNHHTGKARNIAVVHTGHIAAMADSKELIDVSRNGQVIEIEGYLIEISNLKGLSGAPVFVRQGLELTVPTNDDGGERIITTHTPDLRLLGVWSDSWDKPLAYAGDRIPVGMGIVAPASRLLELLNSNSVAENRIYWKRRINAATED